MTVKREIRVEGDVAYIPLTRGYEAIIDAADVPLVEGLKWQAQESRRRDGSLRTVYAKRTIWLGGGRQDVVFLHRAILGATKGAQCDHINGNGLDNRRVNLRLATPAENNRNARLRVDNSSGIRGVSWCRRDKAWQAYIRVGGRNKQLGLFTTLEDAAAAYAAASAEYHGEYGRTAHRGL